MKSTSKLKRQKVFNYDNCCQMCGVRLQNESVNLTNYMQIDHLVAKSRGGKNDLLNLRPLCVRCNTKKSNKNSVDIALTIKKNSADVFCDFQLNLLKYEKNNLVFEKDVFIDILKDVLVSFSDNINTLIKKAEEQ